MPDRRGYDGGDGTRTTSIWHDVQQQKKTTATTGRRRSPRGRRRSRPTTTRCQLRHPRRLPLRGPRTRATRSPRVFRRPRCSSRLLTPAGRVAAGGSHSSLWHQTRPLPPPGVPRPRCAEALVLSSRSRHRTETVRTPPQMVLAGPEARWVGASRDRAPRLDPGGAAVAQPRRSGPRRARRRWTTARAAAHAQTLPVLTKASSLSRPSRPSPVGAAGVAAAAGGAAPAHVPVPTQRQWTQAARTVRAEARTGAARRRGNLVTPGGRLPRTSLTPRRTPRPPRSHAAAVVRARARSQVGRPVTR